MLYRATEIEEVRFEFGGGYDFLYVRGKFHRAGWSNPALVMAQPRTSRDYTTLRDSIERSDFDDNQVSIVDFVAEASTTPEHTGHVVELSSVWHFPSAVCWEEENGGLSFRDRWDDDTHWNLEPPKICCWETIRVRASQNSMDALFWGVPGTGSFEICDLPPIDSK